MKALRDHYISLIVQLVILLGAFYFICGQLMCDIKQITYGILNVWSLGTNLKLLFIQFCV